MCKDTVAVINEYEYDKEGDGGSFVEKEGQMNGLSISKSNVNILCGDKDDNNAFCSFTGGTFHIAIESNTDDKEKPIENVQIQGFKFSQASETNIVLQGGDVRQTGSSRYGSIVLVKNCHFTGNNFTSAIWLYENYNQYLEINDCIFDKNTLNDIYLANNGIITSHVAGTISVTDSIFEDNDVTSGDKYNYGYHSIIYATEQKPSLTSNQHQTELSITGSTVKGNKGMTFALAMIGLYDDGYFTESNNYQSMNEYDNALGQECGGVAKITKDYYYFDYYYNDTYYWENSTDFASCLAEFSSTAFPTVSLLPSLTPSTLAPSYTSAPSLVPSYTSAPSLSPSKEIELPCDNGPGFAVKDNISKARLCKQKSNLLGILCKQNYFSSVCRESCGICTPVVPTVSPISVSTLSPSSSTSGVCDNGPGYAVDPNDKRSKQIACGLSKKKLVEFCPQEFFNSVCRKKCKKCTIVEPTASPIIVPSGVCDNGPGYAIDPNDKRSKKIACGLSKKKLLEFCPQEFFNSVCRKKCDQCASGEPSFTSEPMVKE